TLARLLPAFVALLALALLLAPGRAADPEDTPTRRAKKFVAAHDKRVKPLEVANNLAWWNASTKGGTALFKKKEEAQNKLAEALADPKAFAELKALRAKRKEIEDPALARCVDVLYLQYLETQVDTELLRKMVAKANAVEEAFNKFRAKAGGKEL